MSQSEPGLIAQAQGGDANAFASLIEGRWDGLVRLARSVVGESEAEDAVQDGLLIAWRKLAALRDPGAFAPWLTRLVLRTCLKRARWRRLRPWTSITAVPEPSTAPDPAAGVEAARLLARLAPRQRAVLHLTAVEGLSDGEIAVVLHITAGSVRAHRRRARERLAGILNGDFR